MLKKFVSVFVVAALIIFSMSCYSTRVHKGLRLRSPVGKHYKIFMVITESGKIIQFQGDHGAQIMGNIIMGETYVDGQLKVVRIPIKNISKVKIETLDNTKTILLATGLAAITLGIGFFILFGISFGGH